MKIKISLLAVVAALLISCPAFGALSFTITEVGNDVVVNGTGSVDTSVLTPGSGVGTPGFIQPAGTVRLFVGIPASASLDTFEVSFSGPTDYGTGNFTIADSGVGDLFGFNLSQNYIAVPQGYNSGDSLNSSMTYDNTDLATLGVTPGTYVWNWGSGPNADSLSINAVVPEPRAWAMIVGLVALGIATWRRRV